MDNGEKCTLCCPEKAGPRLRDSRFYFTQPIPKCHLEAEAGDAEVGAAGEVGAVHGAVDVGEAQHGEEAQDIVVVLKRESGWLRLQENT